MRDSLSLSWWSKRERVKESDSSKQASKQAVRQLYGSWLLYRSMVAVALQASPPSFSFSIRISGPILPSPSLAHPVCYFERGRRGGEIRKASLRLVRFRRTGGHISSTPCCTSTVLLYCTVAQYGACCVCTLLLQCSIWH